MKVVWWLKIWNLCIQLVPNFAPFRENCGEYYLFQHIYLDCLLQFLHWIFIVDKTSLWKHRSTSFHLLRQYFFWPPSCLEFNAVLSYTFSKYSKLPKYYFFKNLQTFSINLCICRKCHSWLSIWQQNPLQNPEFASVSNTVFSMYWLGLDN